MLKFIEPHFVAGFCLLSVFVLFYFYKTKSNLSKVFAWFWVLLCVSILIPLSSYSDKFSMTTHFDTNQPSIQKINQNDVLVFGKGNTVVYVPVNPEEFKDEKISARYVTYKIKKPNMFYVKELSQVEILDKNNTVIAEYERDDHGKFERRTLLKELIKWGKLDLIL